MSSDFKFTKELIQLRRAKVLELLAKGQNQVTIAKTLNVSTALISLDIQWIREQAKEGLRTHIQDRLPYEFARAMTGINEILRRASETLDKTTDPKLQHQYMTLLMQLYGTLMNMATDGGIIEQAFKKVERLESNYNDSQIKEDNSVCSNEQTQSGEPEEDIEEE